MNHIIQQLKLLQQYQQTDKDEDIIKSCIDGIYKEHDFMYAVKKLFETTKSRTIKCFENKDVFIKYRNMHRENYPEWINDLMPDDRYALKSNYLIIIGHCFRSYKDNFSCNHPTLLRKIYEFHKDGIPFWCISSAIKENIDTYRRIITEGELLEFMNNQEIFKNICRSIFKSHTKFKKIGFKLDDIGEKI